MRNPFKTLMLAATLTMAAFSSLGCKSLGISDPPPQTAEEIASDSIDTANDAFEKAVKDIWAPNWEQRRRANVRTKLRDPGGFLERQAKLTAEAGQVQQIQARFTAAEAVIVESWLKARSANLPVPAEPATDTALNTALADLNSLVK